jgi:hypothetical protein
MRERLVFIALFLVWLSSCTSVTYYTNPVVLRHARTGELVTCGPYLYTPAPGRGRYGQTRVAALRQAKEYCLEDFQQQGYVPVRE